MLGQVIDKTIGVFSPGWAAKRMHARAILQRGYDAAKTDRTNSRWSTQNRHPDLELQGDADTTRARVRDLIRNNAYAKGILRALLRNVVGVGIKPQPLTAVEDFNRRCEDLWNAWNEEADAAGRRSFYEMQQLAYSETHEAGEVLINHVELPNDRGRVLPFAIELIDADRIAGDHMFPRSINNDTGNAVRRGVETDALGRTVAFWLYNTHPNDVNTYAARPQRISSESFVHLFKQTRVGQTRGISTFAPVVSWIKSLGYYTDNELQASAVASCFTAAVTTLAGPADGSLGDATDDDATDSDSNTFEYLQPGMVARLLPGETIDSINPSRPNVDAGAWISLMIRSMGSGMGVSYERIARDYSQTNFSSNRASDLEDRREFRMDQRWLISRWLKPTWVKFITACVIAGKKGFPSVTQFLADQDTYTKHEWQPPGWEWVDPKRQAEAAQLALQSGLTSHTDELSIQGKSFASVVDQRKRDQLRLAEAGLSDEENDAEETEQIATV